MCDIVRIRDAKFGTMEETELATVGEVAAALGLTVAEVDDEADGSECLCWIGGMLPDLFQDHGWAFEKDPVMSIATPPS